MNRFWRIGTSIILCVIMCFSCLTMPASATDIMKNIESTLDEIQLNNQSISGNTEHADFTQPGEEDIFEGVLSFDSDNLTVDIECTKADNIPTSAEVTFTLIDDPHNQFNDYKKQSESFLINNGYAKVNFAQFWKIGLKANGETLSIPSDLSVTLTYKDNASAIRCDEAERLHLAGFSDNKEVEILTYKIDESVIDGSDKEIRQISFNGDISDTFGLIRTPELEKTASAKDGDCTVKVAYGEDAKFPNDVTLNVTQVNPDGNEYRNFFNKVQSDVNTGIDQALVYADFYDVSFLDKGKEVEPEASVDMTLQLKEGFVLEQSQDLYIIHFFDDGTWELLPVSIDEQEAVKEKNETIVKELSFVQSSFSKIGIIVFDKEGIYVNDAESELLTKLSSASEIKVTKKWLNENGVDETNSSIHDNDEVTVELQKVTGTGDDRIYTTITSCKLNKGNAWKNTFTFPSDYTPERNEIYVVKETSVTRNGQNITTTYQSKIELGTPSYTESWSQPDVPDNLNIKDGDYLLLAGNISNKKMLMRASYDIGGLGLRNYQCSSTINSSNFSVEYFDSISVNNNKASICQIFKNSDRTWSIKNLRQNKYIYLKKDGTVWDVTSDSNDIGTHLTIDLKTGAISATSTGNITKYLDLVNADGDTGKVSGATTASGIVYYKYSGWVNEWNVTITNQKNTPGHILEDNTTAEISREIDWLGDSVDNVDTAIDNPYNPDTNPFGASQEELQDLYRTYLNYTPHTQSIGTDLVLVLDCSSSMNSANRKENMYKVLDDFLPDFLNDEGNKNRVSIVLFDADAILYQDWTDDFGEEPNTLLGTNKLRHENIFLSPDGTNYEAALLRAHEAFTKCGYSTNKKAMLFLSDGFANAYIMGNDINNGSVEDSNVTYYLGKGDVTAGSGPYCSDIDIIYDNLDSVDKLTILYPREDIDNRVETQTVNAVESFKNHHPDVSIGAIAFQFEFKNGTTEFPKYLKDLSTDGNIIGFNDGNNVGELVRQMNSLSEFKPNNIAITEDISDYVDFYSKNSNAEIIDEDLLDVKISVTKPDGKSEILYTKDGFTEHNIITPTEDNGNSDEDNMINYNIIESVNVDASNRKITVKFANQYEDNISGNSSNINDGYTYTLSYNIKVKQETFNQYAADGYPEGVVGSKNSDYKTNTSSSDKPGFYSSEASSNVSWKDNGLSSSASFAEYMPVVQARSGTLNVKKMDICTNSLLSGVEFTLYRNADANDNASTFVTPDGLTGNYIPLATLKTGDNGNITFDNLRLSVFDTGYTYYLVESKPLDGYITIDKPIKLNLYKDSVALDGSYNNVSVLSDGVTIQVGNESITSFGFTKVAAEDTSKALQGAEFRIYRLVCTDSSHNHDETINANHVNSCWALFATKTSGVDGKINFEQLRTNSIYRLIETKAPKGYVLPTGQWNLSVSPDRTIGISAIESADGCQPPAFSTNSDGTYSLINMKPIDVPISGGLGTGTYLIIGFVAMAAGILVWILGCKRKTGRYSK